MVKGTSAGTSSGRQAASRVTTRSSKGPKKGAKTRGAGSGRAKKTPVARRAPRRSTAKQTISTRAQLVPPVLSSAKVSVFQVCLVIICRRQLRVSHTIDPFVTLLLGYDAAALIVHFIL